MAENRDTKQYPGGILNRIHRITLRTGQVNVSYADSYPDQNAVGQREIIGRTSSEPPVERSQNNGTKANDV